MKKHKINDLLNLINHDYSKVPKSLGLELVNLGFMNYAKLTQENYNYWWYEVLDKRQINKNKFTYDWKDLIPTSKFEKIKQYINNYKSNESIYNLITPISIWYSAEFDGLDIATGIKQTQIIENMYFKQLNQKQLF